MSELKKEPETLTISRAAAVLGFSRNKVLDLISSGHLKSHQMGKRKYLLRDELLKFLGK
jgi:excisionase family DNA binding protein